MLCAHYSMRRLRMQQGGPPFVSVRRGDGRSRIRPNAKISCSEPSHPPAGRRYRRHPAQSRISNLRRRSAAMRRAHAEGVEVVLVTGRRTCFALPIAQQLGFDLWLISSNGAMTRSMTGETFHRDMLPADTCRKLCAAMQEFRGNTVLTFDTEDKGAMVLEHMRELNESIQRWLEKNLQFIDFVIPIENSLTRIRCRRCFGARSRACTRRWRIWRQADWRRTSRCCVPSTRCAISRWSTCSIKAAQRATRWSAGPVIADSPRTGHGHW